VSIIVSDHALDTALIRMSRPFLDHDDALCFSAYGFGWGYRAFLLDAFVAHDALASIDQSPRQLLLAFGIGQAAVRKAVLRAAQPQCGERIRLTAADFR
jgi:hypothetical protein